MGGHQAMLYASQFPERIEALFLVSPACSQPYDEATYDPYEDPDPENSSQVIPREKCDQMIRYTENKQHMYTNYKKYPGYLIDAIATTNIKKMQHGLNEEEAKIVGRCVSTAF